MKQFTFEKAQRGIGIIEHLSMYVNRDVLDQVQKVHVRPHLDCGDNLCHVCDPETRRGSIKRERAKLCCISSINSMTRYKWAKDSLGTFFAKSLPKKMVFMVVSLFNLHESMSPANSYNEMPSER